MTDRPLLVWLRQDLRLADQPALAAAAACGAPVIPCYILDDETPGSWRLGGACRWWLHHSLEALAARCTALGSPLVLRRGPAVEMLVRLVQETSAAAVHFISHAEPWWAAAERALTERLADAGVAVHGHDAIGLFGSGEIRGRQGQPLRVFTVFWRACLAARPPARPLPAPTALRAPETPPRSDPLAKWWLLPQHPDWAGGLRADWQPGEAAGQARLGAFVDAGLAGYIGNRDRPDDDATSRLSPRLHFGEISARQVWHATLARAAGEPALANDAERFLRELGWREFCLATLRQRPEMADQPLQSRFAALPWRPDARLVSAWQRGETGYPIVDAGMRQLWTCGWMHNRVRMVVASFLIKHLLQPWQVGAAWFWDTLVDADLANNAGGWQWVAGCGLDAAPYFRIFNPVTQGQKFDAAGSYVRRWLPELAPLSNRWIHRPWEAPPLELAAAGVHIGRTYPNRLVDHAEARQRALLAFSGVKTDS